MGIIMFNGVSSEDFGILVEHPPGYQTPERDYEVVHVPGRNGDVLFDSGSYANGERPYELAFGNEHEDYYTMANRVSQWLHEPSGYARLEDSYEPDVYRLGYFKDSIDFTNILAHAGRATAKFVVKPQRFLKIGEESTDISNGLNLFNPTAYNSKPILKLIINKNFIIKINNKIVLESKDIPDGEREITIDCELMNAVSNGESANKYLLLGHGFPELVPGDNVFDISEGITKMEVIPRWWTI